jgi:hypothetical protein
LIDMEQHQVVSKAAAPAAEPGRSTTAASRAWAAKLEQAEAAQAVLQQDLQVLQQHFDSDAATAADSHAAARRRRFELARKAAELGYKLKTSGVPSSVSSRPAQHSSSRPAQHTSIMAAQPNSSKAAQHTNSTAAQPAATAQPTEALSRLQEQLTAVKQALEAEQQARKAERRSHALTRGELLSTQQQLASTSLALSAC